MMPALWEYFLKYSFITIDEKRKRKENGIAINLEGNLSIEASGIDSNICP